jgi:signal transduction histidine kinase
MSKQKCLRLQTKLGIAFSALVIITSALLTLALFFTIRHRLREDIYKRLQNIVSLAALQVDGDLHSKLTEPNQESGAEYLRIKWTLQKIRNCSPDIRYVYTWRFNNDGKLVFVVDAETDPKEVSHLGDIYHCEKEDELLRKLASIKGAATDDEFTSDQWGLWLSGYAPFYKSDGSREGILGMDIAAADVLAQERKLLSVAVLAFVCTIPLGMAAGGLLGRKLAWPIKKLTVASERLAEGDLNYRVQLHCSNEIGTLSQAFNRMAQKLQEEIQARGSEIERRSKTEKKLAELNRELESTVNELSEANRELSEVAYIAAHDLKTPARAVGSLASMMLAQYGSRLDEEAGKELGMIVAKAEKMNELLDGMLEYCRLERHTGNCRQLDTNRVVEEVLANIRPPDTVKITIENKLPVVECEQEHMMLLFKHLITNAIKFMDKPEGLIKIACTDKDDFWRFSVSDNGQGIEQKYYKKIFKLFQTLDTHDNSEGIGLGLTIAKKIVEMYQGAIWVESKLGVGSTFFFALPKQHCRKDTPDYESQEITIS